MSRTKLARRMTRPLRDFALGLLLFLAFATSGVVDPSGGGLLTGSAHAGWLEELPSAPASAFQLTSDVLIQLEPAWSAPRQAIAFLSLALAFSLVFAANLWFARHLRRVEIPRSGRR